MIIDEFKDSDHQPPIVAPEMENLVDLQTHTSSSKVLAEELISLLEERLLVNITRRKIGEVVVRKEIETDFLDVKVPICREKLIVEQVSPEYKLLAEINLRQEDICDKLIAINDDFMPAVKHDQPVSIDFNSPKQMIAKPRDRPTLCWEFDSPKAALDFLNRIDNISSQDLENVRVEIVFNDKSSID